MKAWNKANQEKVRAYGRAAYSRLTPEQKAYKSSQQRRNYLRRKYKITEEDVEKLRIEQEGCCRICGVSDRNARWRPELVIDHCHQTGAIRGLLCNRCNPHLGWYEEHREKIRGYLGEV